MGSATQTNNHYALPAATCPSLVLAHPTADEKRRTWTLNHREWGGALTLAQYLEREPYLTTVPLSRDGGMTHWILTDSAWTPTSNPGGDGDGGSDIRPVLASCESIRKRVLVAAPGDAVASDGLAHGIGSVFTYPAYRGNRYAGRMLAELGAALRTWQQQGDGNGGPVRCSALWSDIGKTYYAAKGWAAYPSSHVEFPAAVSASVSAGRDGEASPITYGDLAALCERDETLLRARLVRVARETGRVCVAFAPDHDTLRWHLYRDDFIASVLFRSQAAPSAADPSTSIKGALAGSGGCRVWAVWSRNYGGGSGSPAEDVARNTLYILRLVVEPEAGSGGEGEGEGGGGRGQGNEDVLAAFKAVLRTALREAAAWHLGKVDLWNPSPAVRRLVEDCGLEHRWVHRDTDSIPSMMWYGDGDGDGDRVEWIANEKYCWC
ncbi:hypothetical protein GGR54DRAFT_142084 [Hypoxylon sp. NC1633]|nr:hypothetical protein GGR54DRAFT_142084 [Hypoxylon sp. NC1633]